MNFKKIEACHCDLNENLQATIANGKDAKILCCGEISHSKMQERLQWKETLEKWLSDQGNEKQDIRYQQVKLFLGKRNQKKEALVTHLVRRIEENGYKLYDKDEDFNTIESRIQHFEICHYRWEDNLNIILHEIGEGRRLCDWNKVGGFMACGDDDKGCMLAKAIMRKSGIEGEVNQENIINALNKMA